MTNLTSVKVEEHFAATPESVWKGWTEPGLIMQWFGSDPKGTVVMADLDVRPGGNFEITFRDGDGTEHTCFGVYREVEPFSQLGFTFTWKNEPAVEAFILVRIVENSGYTSLSLEHHNPGSAALHNYEKGWKDTLAKLQRVLETK